LSESNAAMIGDVADTARWVAYFRALESERPDRLFHDPFARALAGTRGRAIAEALPKGPLSWSLAVRTRAFDELILDAIRDGVRIVLNLAAGLDTRPYRLSLPADVRWIEADFPSILDLKDAALSRERPNCEVERVPVDVTDRKGRVGLFERVGASGETSGERVLVVTEGLLVYLEPDVVASLADDLHRLPKSQWLLEMIAPLVLARQKRLWGRALRPARAEHKFAPPEGLAFFASHGWTPSVTRALLDEAQRLRREMPMAWLVHLGARFAPARYDRLRRAVLYAVMRDSAAGS